MQIFVLDYNPCKAAKMLCDVHLRKMCLENAQILSGALRNHKQVLLPGMPKCFNCRHKVVRAFDNLQIINWVVIYNYALHREFLYRFGKKHAYFKLLDAYKKLLYTKHLPVDLAKLSFARNFKAFAPAASDIVEAYRKYYCCKKTVLSRFTYTRRSEPAWLTEKAVIGQ